MLKIELQAYEIIVAGAFVWVAGEMRRLSACFDNPARILIYYGTFEPEVSLQVSL